MADVTQVTAGKPKVGGHIFRAPIGTALPTDATTALNEAFIDMGYASEDGMTNNNSPESTTINAWGGTPVLVIQESKEDNFGLTFISAENLEVQKMVYGATNVSGSSFSTGVSVTANAKELEEYSYVIEMIARGNIAHRVVLPKAKPTEIGEITYSDTEALGYEVTLGCAADAAGNTHYEYWKAVA